MGTIEENLAYRAADMFISNLSSRHFSALEPLFSENATYWVSGDPSKAPWAGELPISERLPQLLAMHGDFESFNIERRAFVAEGRTAAIEFSVQGDDAHGGQYRNDVVMIIKVDDDGMIISLREYLDNMKALAYIEGRGNSTSD